MVKPEQLEVLVVCHSNLSFGALEVINHLINDSRNFSSLSLSFVVSTKNKPSENVKIAAIYKGNSLIHRLFFELATLKRLLKESNYHYVLSLQNFVIGRLPARTGVLLHQSLIVNDYSFPGYEWKLQLKTWIMKWVFKLGLKNSDDFFVQLPYMKKQLIERYHIDPRNVFVVSTYDVTAPVVMPTLAINKGHYFYPATPFHYKNHHLILHALRLLPKLILDNIVVEFTFDAQENTYAKKLSKIVNLHQLPVKFIGSLSHESLMKKYHTSTLLYPSLLESLGFPLIEAKSIRSPIIVIDLPYTREVLSKYDRNVYFKTAEELSSVIVSNLNDETLFMDSKRYIDAPSPSLLAKIKEVMS